MERMRTFLLYLLAILGFMFLSYVLENGLIENMYKKMNGNIEQTITNISIEEASGKATNVNGYMSFKLLNNSSYNMKNHYVKIELYSKQGLLAATKYVEIPELQGGQSKDYQVKFKANEIRSYNMSVVTEIPDKTNIINILGWEIDLSDVFGMDLTNATLFGVKLTELFSWDGAKSAGANAWNWSLKILEGVPLWAYAIATGLVIWYMPARFLFGIFPI